MVGIRPCLRVLQALLECVLVLVIPFFNILNASTSVSFCFVLAVSRVEPMSKIGVDQYAGTTTPSMT
jgi:hypothetical protein